MARMNEVIVESVYDRAAQHIGGDVSTAGLQCQKQLYVVVCQREPRKRICSKRTKIHRPYGGLDDALHVCRIWCGVNHSLH